MKKEWRKEIVVATCLLVLLTSGFVTSLIQHPVIATNIHHIDETEKVVVQIMDESNIKEIVVTLTKQKATELENAIERVSKQLHDATSYHEIRKIYSEALCWFQSFGLLPEWKNHTKILHRSETRGHINLPDDVTQLGNGEIRWNACCSIAGDTTNTRFAGIRCLVLERIATYLQQHGRGKLMGFLMVLSLLLETLKPYSMWHRIYLGKLHIPGGVIPAEGWMITCGLTGIRKWNESITGNIIKDPWYDSTGAIGFTGVKILHRSLTRHFYLGTALLVSIM